MMKSTKHGKVKSDNRCGLGLSGHKLWPTLTFIFGCVAAVAGIGFTIYGAIRNAMGYTDGSPGIYINLFLLIGVMILGVGTIIIVVSFIWVSLQEPSKVDIITLRDARLRKISAITAFTSKSAPLPTETFTFEERINVWFATQQPQPPTPEPDIEQPKQDKKRKISHLSRQKTRDSGNLSESQSSV